MKLVFLDVDGVLNKAETQGVFEERCFQALKTVIEQTGAKIVLSSTWRYSLSSIEKLSKKLQETGVLSDEPAFVGFTPDFNRLVDHEYLYIPKANSHSTRTDEILFWIKYNTSTDISDESDSYLPLIPEITSSRQVLEVSDSWNPALPWINNHPIDIEQFLVLDDMNLLQHSCYKSALEGHFIRTPLQTGLDAQLAEKAIEILNSPFDINEWKLQTFVKCSNPHCGVKELLSRKRKQKSKLNIFSSFSQHFKREKA